MIDSPALVPLERTGSEIIPKCELLFFRVQLAEDVDKTPAERLFVSLTNVLVKTDMPQVLVRTMNVDWFRGHVHIATP